VAEEGTSDRLQQIVCLFAHGPEAAPDAGKDLGAMQDAKAGRDLLFDFDHSDVLVGLAFGERRLRLVQEGQRGSIGILELGL
jgi:hypothetical protein